jgi:hypothetical protein
LLGHHSLRGVKRSCDKENDNVTGRVIVSAAAILAGMVMLFYVQRGIADIRRFLARVKRTQGEVIDSWSDGGDGGPDHWVLIRISQSTSHYLRRT